MHGFNSRNHDSDAILAALSASQAIIEFTTDGIILNANENFLNAMGYTLEEIKGKHHRMFCDSTYSHSSEYSNFWDKLANGEYQSGQYKRFGKDGKEIWIEASYNPVSNGRKKPYKVVKYATDITAQKLNHADSSGQIDAINKSQAVIHFNLDGTIITANDNFLTAMGYSLGEIKGKHHRMFVDSAYGNSAEYTDFWAKLNKGQFQSGQYKRHGKGGKEIWIEASYNPILDMNGQPFKVVKFATDITSRKLQAADAEGQIAAIGKSQAVIHFNLDGTIITANDNFLNALGYTLEEVKGKHHRMFVDPAYGQSNEYKEFWEKLGRGEYQAAEYKRIGKGGKEVWILASYNPILDMNGKPFKVVKFATDITEKMNARITAGDLVEESLGNAQSVGAAVEELTAAVGEISQNMHRSQQAIDDIVSKTSSTNEASGRMQTSAESMENVVNLIRNIASQVNLLALNATIEAARAGEAVRGFAVVAAEVKNLANQTSRATDEIAKEIADMQLVAGDVGKGVLAITDSAGAVSQYVSGVAGAIEEQSAVTREISSTMQRTTEGIKHINECVQKISGKAA